MPPPGLASHEQAAVWPPQPQLGMGMSPLARSPAASPKVPSCAPSAAMTAIAAAASGGAAQSGEPSFAAAPSQNSQRMDLVTLQCGVIGKKRGRACTECHRAKAACQGDLSADCHRCARLGRKCITLERQRRRRRSNSIELTSEEPDDSDGLLSGFRSAAGTANAGDDQTLSALTKPFSSPFVFPTASGPQPGLVAGAAGMGGPLERPYQPAGPTAPFAPSVPPSVPQPSVCPPGSGVVLAPKVTRKVVDAGPPLPSAIFPSAASHTQLGPAPAVEMAPVGCRQQQAHPMRPGESPPMRAAAHGANLDLLFGLSAHDLQSLIDDGSAASPRYFASPARMS